MQNFNVMGLSSLFGLTFLLMGIPGIGQDQVKELYDNWSEALNENAYASDFESYYDSTSFISYGRVIESGKEAINLQVEKLKTQTGKIQAIEVLDLTKGNSGNIMSIAKITTAKGSFLALTTWRNRGGSYTREFEVILPQNTASDDDIETAIGLQRQKWEDLSNAHEPSKLIKELCALDVNYISSGRKIVGQEELIKAYKYMEGEQWKIKLTKKYLVQVDDKTAFEIGSYVSSGQGQYLLIWRKRYWDGQWVIETDSNF